jgi:hypothetical protein
MTSSDRIRPEADNRGPDSPERRRQRKTTGWLALAAVILVDGSYLLVLALDEGARLTFGSNLFLTLFVTPLPVGLAGLICLGMTQGSQKAANAGGMTAGILVVVAAVFAGLKVAGIGSYGDAMDGAIVVVELAITTIVAGLAVLVALIVAPRGSS